MYDLPLIVCLSFSFIFQILQAYCFLTLVRSRTLTSNEMEGVEPWGPTSSGDPQHPQRDDRATVLTDCFCFLPHACLTLVKPRIQKNQLEGILVSAEPNPSLYKWEHRGPERGRDIFMGTQLMETDPEVELRVLSPSPVCINHMLQLLSQKQCRAAHFLWEGQGSALIAANRERNGEKGQAYLALPFSR